MTVAEYAAAVCDPVDPPDDATWRQIRAKLRAGLDGTKGINPPTAVRNYHLATLAAIKETLEATAGFDQDALVNILRSWTMRALGPRRLCWKGSEMSWTPKHVRYYKRPGATLSKPALLVQSTSAIASSNAMA